MNFSKFGKLTKLTSLGASLLVSGPIFADSFKKIQHTIDAASLLSLEIQASVAEMDIEFYEGDEIEVEIELEADGHWLSWRRGDVDDVELEVRRVDDTVYLGIAEQKIQQDWRVKLPARLAIFMEVGVGDIRLENLSNSLEMDVGVGSVRVDTDASDFALIHAAAGVGDTAIKGFSGHRVDNERSFMSSESYYRGEGSAEIEIEVGVGDVEIRSR